MAYRILCVEAGCEPLATAVPVGLGSGDGFRLERARWERVIADGVERYSFDVIVAVMVARAAEAAAFFRRPPPPPPSALPDHLFENELFGHARGAFTDAHRDHRGLVATAEGGTLFLDEIDALSPPAQAKLLRFLQERTFKALGSERMQRADVNVIAASN